MSSNDLKKILEDAKSAFERCRRVVSGDIILPDDVNCLVDTSDSLIKIIEKMLEQIVLPPPPPPPPPTFGWQTTGAYMAREDPGFPLRSKLMQKRCSCEALVGPPGVPAIVWSYAGPGSPRAPVTGDIDGDGKTEIVYGDAGSQVHCLRGEDGALKWSAFTGAVWYVTVFDIDGDGDMEIIATSSYGFVYCIDSNGQILWTSGTLYNMQYSTSLVMDVDGDGALEIVVGDGYGNVICMKNDGSIKWINNDASGDTIQGIAAADIDGDGEVEIIASGWADAVVCIRGRDGTLKWKYVTPGDAQAATLCDVDGDGLLEILADVYLPGRIICLEPDGTLKWSFITPYELWAPAIGCADIDNDGTVEVLEGDGGGCFRCIKGSDGSLKWMYGTGDAIYCPGCAADLDGGGYMEVVFGDYGGYLYILTHAGSAKDIIYMSGRVFDVGAAAIDDVDGDGKAELIAVSTVGLVRCIKTVPLPIP